MSKKKIIAILLFIFVSLFMFVFADTGKDEVGDDKLNINENEEVSKEKINTDSEENSNTIVNIENNSTLLLDPNDDEDQDGYTNAEEKEYGSDLLDPSSKPFDNIAPIITIKGQISLVIFIGDKYVDEGATAKDNLDGDITDKIVITNSVNTLVSGNYEVIYTVEDRAGNATMAIRDVKVASLEDDEDGDGYTNREEVDNNSDPLDPESIPEDQDAPVIILKGVNPTVLLEYEEYEDKGAEATDNLDGDITDKIVTDNQVNTDKSGEYKVTYKVEDRAGNSTVEVRDVKVLSRNGDEDQDGYTNKEEKENGTDPLNRESKPVDNAPVITINPNYVEINEGESYDVMTGVSVLDDFDTVTVIADTTDTTTLIPGIYTITYTTTSDRKGQTGTLIRSVVVKAIDKEPPVITAIVEDAKGQSEAVINVNVADTGSGVKEVHYLPKAYDSIQEYLKETNSVDPIKLTLDENGDTTITSYFNATYTIYAVDNKGNETIEKVSTTGIKQNKEDIIDDDSATIESIKGVTIKIGKNTTQAYSLGLIKINPRRSVNITANEDYEVQSIKWDSGRQTLKYFQDGKGNTTTLNFTLGNSRYTNVYTLYVKTKNTSTDETYEGIIYVYNNAYFLYFFRI